ncbi:hypothetical protein J6590_055426 [Homalodisca vitripennis]|nr:hypothetical protein J6590_055426 [Homalodisca vitripennis]
MFMDRLQIVSVEPDEGFEHFVTTVEAEDDWNKAKEAEQNAADALMTNVKLINSVHDEMCKCYWSLFELFATKCPAV